MKPAIGLIVLYQAAGKQLLPAVVLEIHEPREDGIEFVDLEVFGIVPDSEDRFRMNVKRGAAGDVGTWHWPLALVGGAR